MSAGTTEVLASADVPAERRLSTAELSLVGMHCSACAIRIQSALGSQPGVASAAVNLATNTAFIAYDDRVVGTDNLCEAVAAVGYTAATLAPGATAGPAVHTDRWVTRAAVAWTLSIAALCLAMFGPATAAVSWSVLILAVAVELGGGWPFLRATIRL
ncbi:MAG: cation transporter, partial [Acidimicrobiales bacterium]